MLRHLHLTGTAHLVPQDSAAGGSPHAAAVAGAMAEMTDAEIAAAIKTTMNRLQTMSLPLSLLRGAGSSSDALAEAVKVCLGACLQRALLLRKA